MQTPGPAQPGQTRIRGTTLVARFWPPDDFAASLDVMAWEDRTCHNDTYQPVVDGLVSFPGANQSLAAGVLRA